MKKVHFLSAALMALALTACNDDPVADKSPSTGNVTNTEGKYLAIAISNSDASGSRADATGELPGNAPTYVNGTDEENAINMKYLRFYFFYADGTPFDMTSSDNINNADGSTVASNMITPVALQPATVNNQVATAANAVLVLGKAVKDENDKLVGTPYEGGMPSSVICVANTETTYEGLTRAALIDKLTIKLTENLEDDKGNKADYFVMSSSAFWNHAGNYAQYWADIDSDNIQDSPEDALTNPVQIYIERLAAKVQIPTLPDDQIVKDPDDPTKDLVISYLDWDDDNGTYTTIDNVKVKAKTIGWNINSVNTQVRVIKNIADYTDNVLTDAAGNSLIGTTRGFFSSNEHWSPKVNGLNGARSFWASTSNQATPTTFIPNQPQKTPASNDPMYITPNCKDPFLQWSNSGVSTIKGKPNYARSHATKIIVPVEFYIADEGGNIIEKMNLMKWAGMYYTPKALCHAVAAKTADPKVPVGFRRCTSVHSTPEKGEAHNYQVKFHRAQKNDDGSYSFENFGFNIDLVNDIDKREELTSQETEVDIQGTQYWNGMGYYIVNISNQLRATKQGNAMMYGVVRNTIYDYEVQAFYGLGTPVPTPDKPTEVENPEEGETYVAARLNILNWRLVANKVILQ